MADPVGLNGDYDAISVLVPSLPRRCRAFRSYPQGVDLESAAERFDAAYSEMTVLQRRLIAAQREEVDEAVERELIEQASVYAAAVQAGRWALGVGGPSYGELEANAMAARVLRAPVDHHLLLMGLKAQARRYAYPLLAAALRMSAREMPDGLAERELLELLAAPQSMGSNTAQRLLEHWGMEPDVRVQDLDPDSIPELCDKIEDAGAQLPGEVRGTRTERAPDDGHGAGDRVLSAWVDACGAPLEGVRPAAAATARREGWPDDAAPVALILSAWTLDSLMPRLMGEDWMQIASIADPRERIKAIKQQSSRWFQYSEDEQQQILGYLLRLAAEVLLGEMRLKGMAGDYSKRAAGQSAVQLSRTLARRCGEILSGLTPEDAEEALQALPQPQEAAGVSEASQRLHHA